MQILISEDLKSVQLTLLWSADPLWSADEELTTGRSRFSPHPVNFLSSRCPPFSPAQHYARSAEKIPRAAKFIRSLSVRFDFEELNRVLLNSCELVPVNTVQHQLILQLSAPYCSSLITFITESECQSPYAPINEYLK